MKTPLTISKEHEPNEQSQWTDRSVASDVILTPLLAAAGIILGVSAGIFTVEFVLDLFT